MRLLALLVSTVALSHMIFDHSKNKNNLPAKKISSGAYAANILLYLFGCIASHAFQGGQILNAGSANGANRSEVFHEYLFALGTNARNLIQRGFKRAI